jgi:hypothetical protein
MDGMDVEDPFGPVMRHVGGCGRLHAYGSACPDGDPAGHEVRDLEHDITTLGDLARGVRVFLRHDSSRREEPA